MRTIFIEGNIAGHASPRWKNPGTKEVKVLNQELSIERAEETETFLQEIFQRKFNEKDIEVKFATQCLTNKDPKVLEIPAIGVGDTVTITEAEGDLNANEDNMRRADINLVITEQIESETFISVDIVIPEQCKEHATKDWAIRLSMSGGAGHGGVGGVFAIGQLKNRQTGQIASGNFIGGGIGVGLQSPGADPGWGEWTNFTTDEAITFEHFDGILARLTMAGVGFLVGYGLAYISFPMLGANSISVGGFNVGAIGADISSNVGAWNVIGTPPGAPCIPEQHLPCLLYTSPSPRD